MKLIFISLLTSMVYTNINCSEGTIKPVTYKTDATTLQLDFDREFKNWLNDTLPALIKWRDQKECSIIKKEVLVDGDSLSLKTHAEYQTVFGLTDCKSKEVLDIISLLREYKESLKKGDKLVFLCYMFYSPSSVEQSRYTYVYEVKNLRVLSASSETEYDYIRGRLSGKKTITKNIDNTETIIQMEFTWNGKKLIKKEISSQK